MDTFTNGAADGPLGPLPGQKPINLGQHEQQRVHVGSQLDPAVLAFEAHDQYAERKIAELLERCVRAIAAEIALIARRQS